MKLQTAIIIVIKPISAKNGIVTGALDQFMYSTDYKEIVAEVAQQLKMWRFFELHSDINK